MVSGEKVWGVRFEVWGVGVKIRRWVIGYGLWVIGDGLWARGCGICWYPYALNFDESGKIWIKILLRRVL